MAKKIKRAPPRRRYGVARTCGNCGNCEGRCPECGKCYPHGTTACCAVPACARVNAPVDCCGCGYLVEARLTGTLDPEMRLVPWADGRAAKRRAKR